MAARISRDRPLHMPCINGPYYREHIPAILREIASQYKPEGFTDNSWSGLSRANICLCDNCRAKFKKARGLDLPQRADWNDRGLSGVDRVELRVSPGDLGSVQQAAHGGRRAGVSVGRHDWRHDRRSGLGVSAITGRSAGAPS